MPFAALDESELNQLLGIRADKKIVGHNVPHMSALKQATGEAVYIGRFAGFKYECVGRQGLFSFLKRNR